MASIEKDKILVYGHLSNGKKEETEAYLAGHSLEMAFHLFSDKEETDGSYPELRKALFYARKIGCPILLVAVRTEIKDIRFLTLLEESEATFVCLDFPWLRIENIPLMKALLLYGSPTS